LGKLSFDTDWIPETPAESFTNASVHPRLSAYIETARSLHGEQYDPTSEEQFDQQAVMMAGHGKKHG
jgi:hypothetical protein